MTLTRSAISVFQKLAQKISGQLFVFEIRFARASRAVDPSGLAVVETDQAYKLKGLILAQNERWRRGLGMQVERESLARGRTAANGVVTGR